MLVELKDRIKELNIGLKSFEVIFDVEGKEKKLDEIGKMMSDPNFWDSNGENQKILRERASILDSIAPWKAGA